MSIRIFFFCSVCLNNLLTSISTNGVGLGWDQHSAFIDLVPKKWHTSPLNLHFWDVKAFSNYTTWKISLYLLWSGLDVDLHRPSCSPSVEQQNMTLLRNITISYNNKVRGHLADAFYPKWITIHLLWEFSMKKHYVNAFLIAIIVIVHDLVTSLDHCDYYSTHIMHNV